MKLVSFNISSKFNYFFFITLIGQILCDESTEIISTTEETSSYVTEVEIISTTAEISEDKCTEISNCVECVQSNYSCFWSVDGDFCRFMDSGDLNHPSEYTNDIIIENQNSSRTNSPKGPSFCPRILNSRNIYVPSDTHRMIKIRVFVIGLWVSQSRFSCHFGAGPEAITTNAFLMADTVYCSNAQFSYSTDDPFINLPLSISWGLHELSNPRGINLTIYKCYNIAKNCTSCLSFGSKYECGWCPGSSTCEIFGQCEETSADNLWLSRKSLCPELSRN